LSLINGVLKMESNLMNYKNYEFDIIIVAGQSNAEGCGRGKALQEFIPDENIYALNSGYHSEIVKTNNKERLKITYPDNFSIAIAAEREDNSGKIGEFPLSFAKEYEKDYLKNGRKILIIRAAIGGTGFTKGYWGLNDILFLKMLELTDYALNLNSKNRLVAFLWHQGEHDAFENPNLDSKTLYNTHYANIKKLVETIRLKYNRFNLPFIAAGFCDEWEKNNHAVCEPIIKAIEDICKVIEFASFVNASDLKSNKQTTANGDMLHFCRESLNILGKRYFDSFNNLKTKQKKMVYII